jgi:SM-20-related protein
MSTKRFSPSKTVSKRQSSASSVIPLQSAQPTCQVTLLLAAGHQHQLTLKLDDPLLHQLFQVMLSKTQNAPPQLLQILVNSGQASLCISSADVMAVVTEPALFIQPHAIQSPIQSPPPIQPPSIQPQQITQSLDFLPAERPLFLPTQFVQIEQFLSPTDHAAALQIAMDQASNFIGSTTTTAADNYRQSSILYATLYPDFYHLLRQKILAVMPTLLSRLQMPEFEIAEVEMQMTAHNDGCFYKVHNDSGDIPTYTRQLTYVYYFYQEPQAFTGGELKIYDTELKNGGQEALANSQRVKPLNNSLVVFDSRLMHEVLPVSCPSRAFANSRFTLNGWLRRSPP